MNPYSLIIASLLLCFPLSAQDSTKVLDAVEVVAYQKIDKGTGGKQIFTLNRKGLSPTTTADVALRYLPGVQKLSDGYQLMGSHRNAKVMIDGEEANEERQRVLLAKDIKRIEVSHFGADGEVINIIRHRPSERNLQGTLYASAGLPYSLFGGGSIAYQTKKWELSWQAGLRDNIQKVDSYTERNLSNYSTKLNQYSETSVQQLYSMFRLNYSPSKHWSTTLMWNVFNLYGRVTREQELLSQPKVTRESKDKSPVNNLGLISTYSWEKSRLRWRASWTDYRKQDRELGAGASYDYDTGLKTYSTDITWLADNLKLAKLSHSPWAKYALYFDKSTLGAAYGEHRNAIHHISVGDALRLSDRLHLSISPQLSHATTSYGSMRRSSWDFTPELSLSYSKGRQSLSFSYYRYVTRPFAYMLSEQARYADALEQVQGNPNLENAISDYYALKWRKQIKKSYLSLGYYYHSYRRAIMPVYVDERATLQRYANAGHQDIHSLSIGLYSTMLKNKLTLNVNSQIGHVSNTVELTPAPIPSNKGWQYSANLSCRYQMSPSWAVDLYGYWQGRSLGFNSRTKSTPRMSLTVEKSLCNNKLNLSLSLRSLWGRSRTETVSLFHSGEQRGTMYSNAMTGVGFTLRWMFGKSFNTRDRAQGITRGDVDLGTQF